MMVMDVEKDCEDALILSAEKLEGKKEKRKQDGRRINSLASGWALRSMLPQRFQADYLKPYLYSIFNRTATGSVTAVVLCVILFLNCCWLLSIPAWNPQERKKPLILRVNISYNIAHILKKKRKKILNTSLDDSSLM